MAKKKGSDPRTIELTNVGPIGHMELRADAPGLYVLRGRNGSGKSTALSAIQTLASGDGRIPVSDGEEQAEVSGLGVRMVVGRNQKRYGELEVRSLDDSGMSIATVVDPGIKDPVAADAKRIKGLVQISGIEASTDRFASLFMSPEEFKNIVQVSSMTTKDFVEMAAKIKRDVDAAALQNERDAQEKKAQADGYKKSLPETLEDDGEDESSIREKLDAAKANLVEVSIRKKSAIAAHELHKANSEKLSKVSMLDLDAIIASGKDAGAKVAALEAEEKSLKDRLAKVSSDLAVAKSELISKKSEYSSAVAHNQNILDMQASLSAGLPEIPSDSEIAAYEQEAEVLFKKLSAVQDAAKLHEIAERAAELISESEEHRLLGERYREIASKIDTVLSDAVSEGGDLRVNAKGRLVLNTDRGEELFSELSMGERFREVLRICVKAMERRFPNQLPVIAIPQEAYESLQPSAREDLAKAIFESDVVAFTAQAADNEEIVVEMA